MDGKTLTFGHEGILYKNSFIMYDKGTESLWVHVTGEAVKGPMKGKSLVFLPSTITTWEEWKTKHPSTKVLTGRKARGFMGSFRAKKRPEAYGLSLGQGKKAKLYPYKTLKEEKVVNDKFDGEAVVVIFDEETATGVAFKRYVEGKVRPVEFEFAEKDSEGRILLRDKESETLWDGVTGEAVRGKRKGEALEQVPATPWLNERWKAFYPKGEVYR